MRVTNQLLVNNFLSDLRRIQEEIARLQEMSATGRSFQRPGENPTGSATSLDLHNALSWLHQYNRNIDDGLSRMQFTESSVYDVDIQLQRLRELTVQASNSYLTRDDRSAIATEINQLLEHVVDTSNSSFRGRYIFSGYETLTKSYNANATTPDGMTSSVTYQGDSGVIDRNIGINRDLSINFTGRQLFTDQTYTLTGRQLPGTELGYTGTIEINDRLLVITPQMTTGDIRDLLNSNPEIEVFASVVNGGGLVLESLNSTESIRVKDISGSVLSDLGILPEGAFNLAQAGPTLPLTDSRGAIHTSAAMVYPLAVSTANQDLVVTVAGVAIGAPGATQSHVLKLTPGTYNTAADLVAEIQARADQQFGEKVLLVNDPGGGVIELETYEQSSLVTTSDLRIGGTHSDGTVDTASGILGFNVVPAIEELADTAGVDGNDRFVVDLGLAAYRVSDDEPPLDLLPLILNIDASVVVTTDDLVDEINLQILDNKKLSGLIEARNEGGRLRIETTETGSEILDSDLILSNAVAGPVLPLTDTLGALGFYVDPLTGISGPPVPATVFSTAPFPPGVGAIALGVNDEFTIDLGASSSNDGTNPDPQSVVLNPGAYPTALALANEINNQIALNADLFGAVTAIVRPGGPPDFVDLVTTNTGSRVQTDDLVLADVAAGTLANLGLLAPAIPGGGTAAGQGLVEEPHNLIDTMIRIRDELFGFAAPASRLVDLQDEQGASLGLFAGDTIQINSDSTTLEFTVQRFTTMQDLADKIEEKLGFGVEIKVLRNGTLEIYNPTTANIFDVSLTALNSNNQSVAQFDTAFAKLSGTLYAEGVISSEAVYEDERFQRMTNRIGDIDDAFTTILSALSNIGSRTRRLELTQSQNDNVEVSLTELQTENDFADMAEVITKLQEQENVLRAALGTGARLLPPSLFDFLR